KGLSKADARKLALEALKDVNLDCKAESPSHFLSGGEKRRLAVASVLALGRKTVIFDEPYSNLDYPGVKSVNGVLEKLKESGMTIIILTHELEKCLALADRVIVLHQGKKVFDGDSTDALRQDLEIWGVRNPAKDGDPKSLIWR
ncbi:MAG: ABC transporter ATP-binding protein, partial [Spirochaetales bacterium]|nr:ABC transporter ATP-binding protein [Spirochaetales bacterium]